MNKSKVHRYPLRVPVPLWKKIVEAHWKQRKSINTLIIEILEKKMGKKE